MNAVDFLMQIKKIDEMVEDLKDKIERQNGIASGMGGFSVGERVQSTRNLHKMSDAIHESIDLERKIDNLLAQREEIILTINKLPLGEYKVIYKVYVKGYLVKQAAAECQKSYAWAKNMHKKGLEDIQSILDNA